MIWRPIKTAPIETEILIYYGENRGLSSKQKHVARATVTSDQQICWIDSRGFNWLDEPDLWCPILPVPDEDKTVTIGDVEKN